MHQQNAEQLSKLSIPILKGLSPSEVATVLDQGRILTVRRNACLFTAEDKAEHLFIVLKGRIKYSRLTVDGDEVILHLFTPGESFGFASLLPTPMFYMGTTEAVTSSTVVALDRRCSLFDRYPIIKTNALAIALRFLARLSDRHCSLFEGVASKRIARALIDVGRRSGQIHPGGIDVQITNDHLGALADVTRFTASRVLSNWKKAGLISKSRDKVRIHSPEALLSF